MNPIKNYKKYEFCNDFNAFELWLGAENTATNPEPFLAQTKKIHNFFRDIEFLNIQNCMGARNIVFHPQLKWNDNQQNS